MAVKKEASGMDIINNHIESGSYSNIYLMGGEEVYLLYQYRDKLLGSLTDIEDSMNYCAFKGEKAKIDEISEFALTMPFFADRRVLLIEDSDFFKSGNEAAEQLLAEVPDTTVIIFVERNIDKRTKLYKQVQSIGTIAMFSTPSTDMLVRWIRGMCAKDKLTIDTRVIEHLIESVGTDMSMLSNEVNKLASYCIEKGYIDMQAVDELCVSQVENKIFELMDAISSKDRKKAMSRYDDLLQLKEPDLRILFLITRHFDILVKVKFALINNKSYGEIASFAKVPPFTVKNYVKQCEGYSYGALLACLDECQRIKKDNYVDKLSVEMLMVKLMQ